jgi:predicted dehydrogenase
VVFFTSRFVPSTDAWLQEHIGQDWHGAEATWIGSIYEPGNPFAASPWRHDRGGLWDLGPHSLSMTIPLLGRVRRVISAVPDRDGTVRFIAEHASEAVSVQTVGLNVPRAAGTNRLAIYGAPGWSEMPTSDVEPVDALSEALQRLLLDIATGAASNPCDVEFAAHVVWVLERAQELLDGSRPGDWRSSDPY